MKQKNKKNQKPLPGGFVWLSNLVYYFIYRFEFTFNVMVGKFVHWSFHPMYRVFNLIPSYKQKVIRLYGSIENKEKKDIERLNHAMLNPDYSFVSMRATGIYGGSFAFFLLGIHNVFVCFNLLPRFFGSDKDSIFFWVPFGVILIITFIYTHYISEKDDIYLRYFEEFGKVKGQKRWRYKFLAFLIFISVYIFLILTGILAYKK